MRAAPAQHIDVQLVRLGHHEIHLDGRHDAEALEEADAQRAVRHHLRQRQRRRLDVVPALDDLQVRRDRPQVLVRRLVRQVAQAERLPDLARREELLELRVPEGQVSVCVRVSLEGGVVGWTFAGMSRARSGMWRSPITRTSREVMIPEGGRRSARIGTLS
jgi:hypothetical protein